MATRIHPSAVVEPGAQLGTEVEIGAFAYVGPEVQLGDGTRLHHHASVEGFTVLGQQCEIFPYACIGGKTQDLKFKGGRPGLRVGDRNVFREYVTIHAATNDGDFTVLGSDNTVLAYSHIAHDCVLGNHIVMSNAVSMAGHVTVENHVVIGGAAGIHQFCRIGAFAMLSAMAKLVQDLPPYFIADGTPAEVRAFNKVGLERNGHSAEQLERVKHIFRILYREGLNRTQALEKLAAHAQAGSAEFARVLQFAKTSERGLVPGAS
ncbi:MAG: acyl-ACP--UDP-N-acetylglucosamine O-acyltransferase [Opitutaceae bacterium]|nr:acyl-ACP--UDP-N-acetylglucosamine O-acyltransferase [Opitutaceae bacterium]MBP9912848.1 acyl-ACP--UDP-N-acetylglucosamine O-acyltransferase [Opitutaceae bacterium]